MEAACVLGCISKSVASRLRKGVILLFTALVKPFLEYCVQFWASQYRKNTGKLKWVQQRTTDVVGGLKHMMCKKSLRYLALVSLEKGESDHDSQLPDVWLGRTQRQTLLRCTAEKERQWTQAMARILTMWLCVRGKKIFLLRVVWKALEEAPGEVIVSPS